MKALIVLLSLVTSIASAELKLPGQFVPSQCGTYSHGSVCFGIKTKMKGEYLEVAGNDGSSFVFEITTRTPINGGINPKAKAETLSLRSEKYGKAVAVVRSLGNETSVTVHFADGGQITATGFHVVATTL